ncbi:plasmodesmata callose-binding protein 3 [Hibiscus trionum]|uniref:Plasmodesmata callose-binding protein 3 n=1 Tax=Hibiscus trionum TaxID=183268 RepID=A0A9W7HEB6_HIBTR|nr:plasmodesmata callose-binding protein 3 [Hibiscus trionum]
MAALVLLPLLLLAAMTAPSSGTWCICKDGLSDTVLQKTLDYACGEGADCSPTHVKGPCFNPDTVRAHCNYAVNSFFQKKGQAQGTCDFAATATLTNSDPSYAGCPFPATASAVGTTTTPKTTTPTVNPINNTPTSTTPFGSTTPTGILGGVGNGLGPSGVGINPDYSTDRGFRLQYCFSSFAALLFSGLMLLWG